MGDDSHSPQVAVRRKVAWRVAERLACEEEISSLAIYGSVATGRAGPDSDLDLCATYGDGYDREGFMRACAEIGLDPGAITGSGRPEISMTGLLVDGIRIGLMLGPEKALLDMANEVETVDRDMFEQQFYSFLVAEVLFDRAGIWEGVIEKLAAAVDRLGIARS